MEQPATERQWSEHEKVCVVAYTGRSFLPVRTWLTVSTDIFTCRDTKGRSSIFSCPLQLHSRVPGPGTMDRHGASSWYVPITSSYSNPARMNANSSCQGGHSTHAKEHTTTSPIPTLAQATAVLHYRTPTCTKAPTLVENVLYKKRPHSVAYYNPAQHLTHTVPNIFLLAVLRMARQ